MEPQNCFTAAAFKDVFYLSCVKTELIVKTYVFICVSMFLFICLCKGYHNNWKVESFVGDLSQQPVCPQASLSYL